MTLSTVTANALLDHTFGNGSYAQPAACWVQLHYGDPGTDGTNYAWTIAGRRHCSSWEATDSGWLRSAVDLSWAALPDPGVNDTISHFSTWDAAASGTCLAVGWLEGQSTESPVVSSGDSFLIPSGLLYMQVL